ncbi:MAG: beta-propeller fold lactonase family protein, partial [Chloroflexi bacterium]|nr:beta-propeller fold lactonase family protein [Chloroflexota bacterium]
MRPWSIVLSATLLSGALLASSAITGSAEERPHAVFVQGNDPSGNVVLAYRRESSGALSYEASYDTGGKGGRIPGSVADPLASQGSLAFDPRHDLLIGVNAGSDSIYSFRVDGDTLERRQVLSSGGSFPVSIAVHDDLVYVLNAGGSGGVQGYRIDGERLRPIDGSARSLGLTPVTGPTEFVNTPGQVGFTPDGDQLIVTTKANGSHIDVFGVRDDARLSDSPVQNVSATPVPFGFTFDARGRLVVAEAGTSSVSTYVLRHNGTLSTIGSQSDSQAALCWITRDGQTFFGANAGSGSVSAFRIENTGRPTLVGTTS